ncbi:unnamed protein product [Oppiella nova]|uniref:L-aspartate oxidase n=1 Tax=Oppiella nova TaxID=334625 RepID=A0A7R9Q9E8_9ACAR|nr:unnamed protein product [Oppiella nova]CAG2156891.1 unnamed protein product [Oppiella nova]
MRGEGAYLRLPDGERFMLRFDERIRHVWLDISHKPAEFVKEHFPTLYARLLELGIDITKDMIPVVPAAHYTCGGVVVDEHSQTDLAGLYAIGETSYTGLHGANRMASNSLLECFVYGMSAAKDIEAKFNPHFDIPTVPEWDASQSTNPDEDVVILQNWDELRQTMWNYVGIDYHVSKNLIELRNLVMVSEMIVRCAMQRKESRGLHYTLDYPELSPELRKTNKFLSHVQQDHPNLKNKSRPHLQLKLYPLSSIYIRHEYQHHPLACSAKSAKAIMVGPETVPPGRIS